ncbi:MAG: UDP-N-acetylglucosamine 2-epimerase (non-hydrolyzing) [Bacteroidales bacterium]|nr:UDP-N-acetylglucosamine 2-epimerase (non-hydrolyzing) [Bacteroidales bacterium]
MIHLLTIIGARPQFIKAAAVHRALQDRFRGVFRHTLVHTGQHYDDALSSVFIREMQLPAPDHNLGVGSASHARQTAAMLKGLERILTEESPDMILLYGDTNTTLAGILTASKTGIPVAHIEAGLRSGNRNMPEEINRIICDRLSTFLFAPTRTAVNHLIAEGFSAEKRISCSPGHPGVFLSGDVMLDNALYYSENCLSQEETRDRFGLRSGTFMVMTIHRQENTDDPFILQSVFHAALEITRHFNADLVFPLHPRTAGAMMKRLPSDVSKKIQSSSRIRLIPPVSYLEMLSLLKYSALVVTDSGGLQKEAYFSRKPCIIFRNETEWPEIVESGAAVIAGTDPISVLQACQDIWNMHLKVWPEAFGNGKAAAYILSVLAGYGLTE